MVQNLARPIINQIRNINKTPTIEKFLAKRTQGKALSNFWVKLLPSIYSYKEGEIRSVERNGIKYKLDISDYMEYILYFGLAEESKEELYRSIRDGMYVFDIGSNVGDTLLNMAKVNPSGMNYGFEPVPFLFERAKVNLALNTFGNISLNNLALSNISDVLYFEIPPNRNSGSISMSLNKTNTATEVNAITFDEFVINKEIPRVDLIKIDVEGFECFVLEGAKKSIKKFKPILFIEVVDDYLKKNGFSAAQLISHVESLGYRIVDASNLAPIASKMDLTYRKLDILCNPI